MKTLYKYLSICAALLAAAGCAKPDPEFVHDDCTISAIYITTPLSTTAAQIQGDINAETGEIMFVIHKREASAWRTEDGGMTKVKVKANIGYDAYITPSLSGLWDLSEPVTVTVSAPMTGASKNYTLQAVFSRD